MLDSIVPEKRMFFCGTKPTQARNFLRSKSLTSTPPIVTLPSVASAMRGIKLTMVDLPDPVEPMIAVTSPFFAVNEMWRTASASPP